MEDTAVTYPNDWTLQEVQALAERMRAGGTPSRAVKEYWGGDIPFALIEDITASGLYLEQASERLTQQGLDSSSAWIVPPGAVLLSMYATIGATVVNRIPVATNQAILAIQPKKGYSAEFLALSLRAHKDALARLNVESTQKNISKGIVSTFKLPVPPLPEQQRIAQVLSTVQEAIAQQERLIRTTTELKQALMQKLFTEGLRGEALKETEIGWVPESWDLVPVGQLFYTQLGKMLSPKARRGSEPKPYLRNKNVQWDGIDTDDLHLMDFDDREMEKFRLEPGDLLVCEGGEVGRTALWKGEVTECYYQKALHRLRPRDGSIRPAFMAYWMRYAFQMHNVYGVTGTRTTIAHLPEIKLTPLPVPLPSVDEQDEMLAALEGTDRKLDHTRHKLTALQDLFRTLLHELMTGKVRVGEEVMDYTPVHT